MTWFKVDDGFHDHPKVEELPNAAVGLWVKAGTWCARHETDGVIPASKVKSLKGTSAQISALIRTGLWVETTTSLGAKAYSFCDWFDYQPSRKEREEEREVWREKKRESRRRKLDNLRKGENVPQGVPEMSPEGQQGGVPQMSGTIPDPTRPDPTNTSNKNTHSHQGSNARETETSELIQILNPQPSKTIPDTSNGYPEGFEQWWDTYPRRVGKRKAFEAWHKAISKRTRIGDLQEATARFAAFHAQQGTDQRYIPHPTTWLNRDGWEDDLTPSRPQTPTGRIDEAEMWRQLQTPSEVVEGEVLQQRQIG